MRRSLLALLAVFAATACATTGPTAQERAQLDAAAAALDAEADAAEQTATAPVAELIRRVDIPHQQFTLDNGLRVIVHEDRKAPVVAVSVWYNVGSKDEPKGKTGFAHLFEHLMFAGSENAPGDTMDQLLTRAGVTDFNGTTWFDRTNYFETVPRSALDLALFLESDRMGHMLGGVTQEKLTNQIAVVQNEKRQGDNEPYGLVEYAQLEALYPEGHPYRHSTIGSMADLDSASLEDVKQWFRDKYGPNNAVLVLAGDISAAEARPLVEKYFGAIPRGAENRPAEAPVPTLPAAKSEVMKDRVANVRLYRSWAVPGMLSEDAVPLDVAATVLGGLASSRLDNALVRKEQTAVRVSAGLQAFHRVGQLEVQADVKPGVDPQTVARRLDEIIAGFIAEGPTADEVQRVVMRELSGRIQGLEQVGGFGGKAVALAEGALYANDPEHYKKQLQAYARVTPADVKAAMQKWLTRPVYALTVVPGERSAYDEAKGGSGGSQRPRYFRTPGQGERPLAPAPQAQRPIPEVAEVGGFDFPAVERARLSNGIEVVYARRTTVPVTRVALEFDAGIAADPADRLGTQSLMLNLLEEGTTTRSSIEIAEEEERLGAGIATGASMDRTAVAMTALSPNLQPSLALMADIVRNPAFEPAEVERLRAQQLSSIASELTQPNGLALRALPPLLYGAAHPYGKPFTGTGDPTAVAAVTRDELIRFHQSWIRPDNAQLFVVSDLPLDQVMAALEAQFGNWSPPAAPRGTKNFAAAPPAVKSRIVLIDRPQSPQSVILAGSVLPVRGTDDPLTLQAANEVLGGDFLARINADLREKKGWSYGSYSRVNLLEHQVPFIVQAPVQANQTGPAIAAILGHIRDFNGSKGVTAAELQRVVLANTRRLPGRFETSGSILEALRTMALYDRPDTYYETLADRYRALSPTALNQAGRQYIGPKDIVWVVVGDASKVRPQLRSLGLPVEVVYPNAAPPAAGATQPEAEKLGEKGD